MQASPIVIFLGPPGAGKGTQAALAAKEFRLTHVSTGEILREAVASGTQLGKKVQEIIESGELVPDGLVGQIVCQKVEENGSTNGFILDGFPRNVPQAEFLDSVLGGRPVFMIDVDVEESVLIKRLSGRRYCSACDKIFNVYFSPPPASGKCGDLSCDLRQRADDREEVIEERLRVYREQTRPLTEYYRQRDGYFLVDGDREVQSVEKEVREIIGRFVQA